MPQDPINMVITRRQDPPQYLQRNQVIRIKIQTYNEGPMRQTNNDRGDIPTTEDPGFKTLHREGRMMEDVIKLPFTSVIGEEAIPFNHKSLKSLLLL